MDFECVNCGRKAWSLTEVVVCEVCGATVVCTNPTVATKEEADNISSDAGNSIEQRKDILTLYEQVTFRKAV